MKKHKLAAVVGTLALTANLLLPGLAFGAQDQTGSLSIACDNTAPSFSEVPATSFDFSTDGAGGPITSSNDIEETYSDPAGELDNVGGEDRYLEVQDVRDFNGSSECGNDGLHVELTVVEDPDNTDSVYFDSDPNNAGGYFIPLTGVYFVTSAGTIGGTCPAGSTITNGVCFRSGTYCQDGTADSCSDTQNAAIYNAASTAFTTPATFTTALGTAANTVAGRTLLNFNGTAENATDAAIYGKAGVGVAFRADVPAFQPNGTYQLNLQYDVQPHPTT